MLRYVGADPLALAVPGVLLKPLRLDSSAAWTPYIPVAYWLVQAVKPRVFVELGTRDGVSYSAFAQGVLAAGLSTVCHGVRKPLPEPTPPGEAAADWPAFHAANFGAFSRLLSMTAVAAAGRFEDGTVDLLHLDGSRDHDGILADLACWRPKLSPQGVIVLSRVYALDDEWGAGAAWSGLRRQYRSFTFTHAGGLGIAAVGSSPPPDIAWLVGLADDGEPAVAVRRFFATLGELHAVRLAVEHEAGRRRILEEQLPAARAAAASAEAERDEARRHAEAMRQALEDVHAREAEARAALDELGKALAASDDRHRHARLAIDGLIEEVTGLRHDLSVQIERGAALAREVEAAQRVAADRSRQLERARADSRRLAAALERQDAELEAGWLHRAGLSAQERLPAAGVDRAADRSAPAGLTRPLRWRLRVLSAILREPAHRARLPLLGDARVRREALAAAHAVVATGLFDAGFYADVSRIQAPILALAWHYEVFGRHTGLDPHPLFDTDYYLASNPDVAANGGNPLLHYVSAGAREGRRPHPLFDVEYYLKMNPDVAATGHEPLLHYLRYGYREARDPHAYFDSAYYLRRYPDVARAGINPLAHFVHFGAAERRDPCPHFSTGEYLDANPDVARAGVNPLVHYLLYGLGEQRAPAAQPPPPPSGLALRSRPSFAVYVSSAGNYFFQEIASVLVAGLEDLGLSATRRSELDGVGPEDFHIAVAPHELFTLGEGRVLRYLLPPERLIVCNTEQPKSRWFGPVRRLLGRTAAVWDIDYSSARLIQAEGFDCHYVPLGHSTRLPIFNEAVELPLHYGTAPLPPEWFPASAGRRPWRERPIDVLFVGHLSERRKVILGALAPVLAGLRCVIHFSDVSRPVLPGVTSFMDTRTVVGLAQRSKVMLNLHHGYGVYFEWHRMVMHGLWQGTLVLTEPAAFAPPLEPGRHFIACPVADLGARLTELTTTEAGRRRAEQVAALGFEAATAGCRSADYLAAALHPLLQQLEAGR